jgi:Inhibitor of sigma-G Gin.
MSNVSVPIIDHPVQAVLLPRCTLCGEVPPAGIRGGIKLRKAFICTSCEQQLIHSDVGSTKYHEFLEKIKQLLK